MPSTKSRAPSFIVEPEKLVPSSFPQILLVILILILIVILIVLVILILLVLLIRLVAPAQQTRVRQRTKDRTQ